MDDILTTAVELDGPVVRVVARGEVDTSTAPILKGAVADAWDRPGASVMVLDLTGVTFIGSVGISVIISAHDACVERGMTLRVAPSEQVRRLVATTGLEGVLPLEPIPGSGT
ncbi:MAG TPA: STAS domain-containing protein [Pseudonocardiaceae bacterium]